MVEINSSDYHDFVIKNGKLIGEFEQMYQKSKNTPWHQDEQNNWLDVQLVVCLLKEFGPFQEISDLGCGYGYFLKYVSSQIADDNVSLHGFDISKTACEKGHAIFPEINFHQYNLMNEQQILRKGKERKGSLHFKRYIMVCVSQNR